MASVYFKRNRWYARLKGDKIPGKWSDALCEGCMTREEAQHYATLAQKAIDRRRGIRAPGALTLREWVKHWLVLREEAGHDWKKDRGRLEKHVLPALGGHELPEITSAHLAELVHALRFRAKLANRTVRNIYSVLAAVFRDARIAGKVNQTPCILTEAQLGPIIDKDPEWRDSALFTREEAQTMIGDRRIPLDRQLVYAFGLLAGLRPGEAAALRWRHYDITRDPLGMLTVARAYSTSRSELKGTKTEAVKYVPVHPVLAAMLAEWRVNYFGGEPGPDDLIVPLPADVRRTRRKGDRYRGWDYTGRRWREIDAKIVGGHKRSVYDTRATFITLALEDGADRDILRSRITHTPPKRDAFDGYDRGERWAETCREVAKLRIRRLAALCGTAGGIMSDIDEEDGLRRRVSNDQSRPPELRVIQGGREDTWCSCHPEVATLSASVRTPVTLAR
jgi:integrase